MVDIAPIAITVTRNVIRDLNTTGATPTIRGIYYINGNSGDVANINNNFITLDATTTTAGATIYGYDTFANGGTIANVYFNSIRIGGTAVTAGSTAGVFMHFSNTTNLKDNIIVNARSNGAGTGKHYDINVSSASNLTTLTSDFNDLLVTGTGGFVGFDGTADRLDLAAWKSNSGKDANSISADPLFVSPSNLHVGITSPVNGKATPIAGITTDIDGDTRSTLTPDIGADEINTPPTITAAAGVTRQQGSPVSNSTIATVNDADSGAGSVVVTVTSANPSNGVTISNIVNTAGTVTADVVASCTATNATFTLQASDGSLTSTAILSVTVTANTPPTLTYATVSVPNGGSTTNPAATGPSDNGSVSTVVVQSTGTYTGTISVNLAGLVSISAAAPIGSHTITIRATDNCGAFTDATFTLNVTNHPPSITAGGTFARQQGSAGTISTVATVSDLDQSAGSLTVTATTVPAGISVTGITNTAGTVTATVAANCTATVGANTVVLTVTDSNGGSNTANFTVNVTANTAPTLTYTNPPALVYGGSTSGKSGDRPNRQRNYSHHRCSTRPRLDDRADG